MAGQDVGTGDLRRLQQRVEIGHDLRGGAGLGDGVTAADEVVLADAGVGPRAVVGADAGDLRHGGQDHRPRRVWLEEIVAPVAGRRAVAGLQHRRWGCLPVALQVERATADVDQTGEVAARRGRATRPPAWRLGRWRAAPGRRGGCPPGRGRWRGRLPSITGWRCMESLRAPSVATSPQRRAAARRGARRSVPQHRPCGTRLSGHIPVGQDRALLPS